MAQLVATAGACPVVLLYLLSHCYQINNQRRCKAAIELFDTLLASVPGTQAANLVLRISKLIQLNSFTIYASRLCQKYNVDTADDSSSD